uniref:Uncharacterized protein n=1 Tax=Panagrolaimus davidi TaxID=227884 RepID=A0A914Q4G4_9BILA
MEPYIYLILIGLHIFALWPITLFYCRSKSKSSLAGKKLATPSKILHPKPGEKKDNHNPQKKTTEISNSKDKKDILKITGTTGETEKSKEKIQVPTENNIQLCNDQFNEPTEKTQSLTEISKSKSSSNNDKSESEKTQKTQLATEREVKA